MISNAKKKKKKKKKRNEKHIITLIGLINHTHSLPYTMELLINIDATQSLAIIDPDFLITTPLF